VTPTRALLAFAAWALVGALFGVVWVLTADGMPPFWLTTVVGLAVFAAVEVGGRVRGRGWR
jgi:hypothetical protein